MPLNPSKRLISTGVAFLTLLTWGGMKPAFAMDFSDLTVSTSDATIEADGFFSYSSITVPVPDSVPVV